MSDTEHVFERAGFGLAPFRVVGREESRYQACHGAPIQPGSSCDYCGQGIVEVWWIRSADGRKFKVGCDCVRKTGDRGLRKAMAPLQRKAEHARDDERIAATRALLADPAMRERLAGMVSPNERRPQDSALVWAEWMLSHSGRAGSVRVCRFVEAVQPCPTLRSCGIAERDGVES